MTPSGSGDTSNQTTYIHQQRTARTTQERNVCRESRLTRHPRPRPRPLYPGPHSHIQGKLLVRIVSVHPCAKAREEDDGGENAIGAVQVEMTRELKAVTASLADSRSRRRMASREWVRI